MDPTRLRERSSAAIRSPLARRSRDRGDRARLARRHRADTDRVRRDRVRRDRTASTVRVRNPLARRHRAPTTVRAPSTVQVGSTVRVRATVPASSSGPVRRDRSGRARGSRARERSLTARSPPASPCTALARSLQGRSTLEDKGGDQTSSGEGRDRRGERRDLASSAPASSGPVRGDRSNSGRTSSVPASTVGATTPLAIRARGGMVPACNQAPGTARRSPVRRVARRSGTAHGAGTIRARWNMDPWGQDSQVRGQRAWDSQDRDRRGAGSPAVTRHRSPALASSVPGSSVRRSQARGARARTHTAPRDQDPTARDSQDSQTLDDHGPDSRQAPDRPDTGNSRSIRTGLRRRPVPDEARARRECRGRRVPKARTARGD
jgi:hypothetical protein